MKTIQEQIAIMQHFANGGRVEAFCISPVVAHSSLRQWRTVRWTNAWDWKHYDYRIADYRIAEVPKSANQALLEEQIAVMQHFANGGKVETRIRDTDDEWKPFSDPLWNWIVFEYRIVIVQEPKKKVKMWQALARDANGILFATGSYFKDIDEARRLFRRLEVIRLLPHTGIEVEE